MSKKQLDPALEIYKTLCINVNSPYARRALQMLDAQDFLGLANQSIDPAEYDCATSFARDYSIYAFLRKYEGFPVDREQLVKQAILDLEKIEAKNRETNTYLRINRLSRDAESVIEYARRKIEKILGEFSFAKVLPHCEWGNGATATLKRAQATVDKKVLESRLSVTSRCLPYAQAWLEHDLHWMDARVSLQQNLCGPMIMCAPHRPADDHFLVIEYGQFDTVPKSIKAVRPIEKQPTLNLFFQKGVGHYIRGRLRQNGIDLNDQSRNQYLASRALADGLATIDLSNASDTVSHELVYKLLPQPWFRYLNDIRTWEVRIGTECRRLERFSAMGNGFTFELESLIFFAIAYGVREMMREYTAVVSIFGDDIVVSKQLSSTLISVLTEVGFTVNKDKSFTEGRFYESCGEHYFDGIEVTPVFQKEKLETVVGLIRAANRILRLASIWGRGAFLDNRCKTSYQLLCSEIKNRHRGKRAIPKGPLWLPGDGFLKIPNLVPTTDRDGIFYIDEYREVTGKKKVRDGRSLLAGALRKGAFSETSTDNKSRVLELLSKESVTFDKIDMVADVSEVRCLLQRRRCCVVEHETLCWARSFID